MGETYIEKQKMCVFIVVCADFEWDKFISDFYSLIYFIRFCFFF